MSTAVTPRAASRPRRCSFLLPAAAWLLLVPALPGGAALAQSREEPPEQPRSQEEVERDAERRREEFIRRREQMMEERRRRGQDDERPGQGEQLRGDGDGELGELPPILDGEDVLVAADVDPDERITLRFSEPVELLSLVDYISRRLKVNILVDEAVQGSTIQFKAPIDMRLGDLPDFLASLLEAEGLALVPADQGYLRIVPSGEVMGVVGEGPFGFATTRILSTPMVRPSALVEPVKSILNSPTELRMTAIDDLGILIMTGAPVTLRRAEDIITRLFEESGNLDLHRFALENVSADYARTRLIELDRSALGLGTPGGGNVNVPNRGGGQPGTASASISGFLGSLDARLFVDQGNAIIFRGTEPEAAELARRIAVVDVVSRLRAETYVLPGAGALRVASNGERQGLGPVIATDQLGGQQRAFNAPRQPGQPGGIQGAGGGARESVATAGSRFEVDAETSSFTYFGTDAQHAQVQAMVDRFRDQAIDTREEIRIYKLRYARAGAGTGAAAGGRTGGTTFGDSDVGGAGSGARAEQQIGSGVAELLTELLQDPTQQRTTGRFLPGSGIGGAIDALPNVADLIDPLEAAAAGFDGDLDRTRLVATTDNTIIVADQARNQLIIKAPARAHEQLERIITQLDQRQPQVYIEAQFVSLTTNDNFDWATDIQLQIGQYNFVSSFGVTGNGDDFTDPRTVAAGTGLTTALIKSDYIPFVINTLQTKGETRIISNPQLLVNDNQLASFRSEEERPFAETTQNANTTTTGQGGTASAGTVLEVTPRISEGSEVTLTFTIELSDFIGDSVDGLQPPSQSDVFDTTVTLPTDTTIVIGGFTLNRTAESVRKVPLLGDIPLLGLLFKDISEEVNQRTIFVFITPRIMEDSLDGGLRLNTYGPLREVGLTNGSRDLEPARIPVAGPRG